eukprot:3938590-Rhodomonas_salina.3
MSRPVNSRDRGVVAFAIVVVPDRAVTYVSFEKSVWHTTSCLASGQTVYPLNSKQRNKHTTKDSETCRRQQGEGHVRVEDDPQPNKVFLVPERASKNLRLPPDKSGIHQGLNGRRRKEDKRGARKGKRAERGGKRAAEGG